jgi:hypothetical protein
VTRIAVDLEIGPFADVEDAAERLTDAVPGDAPDVAFGGNLRTGMVGVSAEVDAESAEEAVIAVMYLLGQVVAGANLRARPTTVRASAEVPVPA